MRCVAERGCENFALQLRPSLAYFCYTIQYMCIVQEKGFLYNYLLKQLFKHGILYFVRKFHTCQLSCCWMRHSIATALLLKIKIPSNHKQMSLPPPSLLEVGIYTILSPIETDAVRLHNISSSPL